jgi:hypothetical protein
MKKTTASREKAAPKGTKGKNTPTRVLDADTGEPGDWRSGMLARLRAIIKQAAPEAVEEVKWRKPSNGMAGVPVWSHGGMICTGETYKSAVKLTFAKGASLEDPSGLFNASLEGGTRRAIDFHQGDTIDERSLAALIRSAVALNTSTATESQASRPPAKRKPTGRPATPTPNPSQKRKKSPK